MHRNTYLLLVFLAVFAALIVGVNVGKNLSKQPPTVTTLPTLTPTPQNTTLLYTSSYCGFSLMYPASYTVLANASGSAILNNPNDKNQSIATICQKEIPRPALLPEKIESLSLTTAAGASISAQLYHDASPKDGTPIDALIFHHPKNGMDVFIAGYGDAFNAAIHSIQILP